MMRSNFETSLLDVRKDKWGNQSDYVQDNFMRGSKAKNHTDLGDECLYISVAKSKSRKPLKVTYVYKSKDYTLPSDLVKIITCIEKAENISFLNDNWDGEGSKGYTEDTWEGVVVFLIDYAKQIHVKFGHIIDIPKIYPSANGSIDIDWETETYGILINVSEGGQQATYYADNKATQMTEGKFIPQNFDVNLLPKAISPK